MIHIINYTNIQFINIKINNDNNKINKLKIIINKVSFFCLFVCFVSLFCLLQHTINMNNY